MLAAQSYDHGGNTEFSILLEMFQTTEELMVCVLLWKVKQSQTLSTWQTQIWLLVENVYALCPAV